MLQSTLLKLKNILDSEKYSELQREKLYKLFSRYESGNWIYAGVVKRKTKMSIKEVYLLLDKMEREEIITSYFEISCSTCHKTLGDIHESINDIPSKIYCENCGDEVDALKNAYLIYQVNSDV